MFYTGAPGDVLRFGDVVRGFVIGATSFKSPKEVAVKREYRVDVQLPQYAAVLSPCCSIGDKTLALTPLMPVLGGFFDNPYLAEDLTRLNRQMTPQQAVPPSVWDQLPADEKARRFRAGTGYAFVDLFLYEEHPLLATYTVRRRAGPDVTTGYYMVDFRRIYRVNCLDVRSPKQAPVEAKILELSVPVRGLLRDKLAWYFGRTPEEDQV